MHVDDSALWSECCCVLPFYLREGGGRLGCGPQPCNCLVNWWESRARGHVCKHTHTHWTIQTIYDHWQRVGWVILDSQSPKAIVIRVCFEELLLALTWCKVWVILCTRPWYFIHELQVLLRPRWYRNSEYFAAVSRDIHSALMNFSEPLWLNADRKFLRAGRFDKLQSPNRHPHV